MTSYWPCMQMILTTHRAELSGIVTILYLTHRICEYYNISNGKIKCYCDNKGALRHVFEKTTTGITPYFSTDHDLVELAQQLLKILSITVLHEWVKGHYTKEKPEFKHILNHQADTVASYYQSHQQPIFKTARKPLPPPNYRVRLIHDTTVITSKVYQTLAQAMHEKPIASYIQCKAKWSPYVVSLVNWDAHERAFKCLRRQQKISVAKLVHNLVNTNHQNHLYYKTSPLCPICGVAEETLEHVLNCDYPATRTCRNECLLQLEKELQQINTPNIVVCTILHGFSDWLLGHRQSSRSHALTVGSLHGSDMLLTTAYTEQFHSIGWFQFCLGRISKKWSQAVHMYVKQGTGKDIDQAYWSSMLINIIWHFTKLMWKHRNQIVHGKTVEDQVAVILQQLCDKAQAYYASYQEDNNSLDQRLCLSFDHLTCWIQSVDEARTVISYQLERDRAAAQRFFQLSSQAPQSH
jgi:hypothetical protein